MSHELRTPLHGILSFAGFGLKKSTTAPPQKLYDYFQKIEQSGRLLLTLLNDLLDLAKLEAGKMSFAFQQVDVDVLIAAVIQEFSTLAAEQNLTLHYDEPEDHLSLSLDSTRIMQVCRNLLSNAIKFSPPGAVIEINRRRVSDAVVVSVCDRGVGMPEDELEVVFDKFVQSSTTKSGAGGTGLGLAICREILLAHSGRIWADNRPGGGTTFSFALPLHREDSQQAGPRLVAAQQSATLARAGATGVKDAESQSRPHCR